MSRRLLGRAVVVLIAVCLATAIGSAAPARGAPGTLRSAESWHASAQRYLQRGGVDARRMAIHALEQATLIDRDNAAYELLLARTYFDAGFLAQARLRYERATRLSPEDAGGRYGLGQVWRRDWLKYSDERSLDRAIDHLSAAARLRPQVSDAWVMLVPLLVERGNLRDAAVAAERAMEANPRRPETMLAVAYTSYRLGRVTRADTLFRAALPLLPRVARERFDDIAPVASAEDTFRLHRMTAAEQVRFVDQFWNEHDPDLVSPENEALLEYWARVAHAYFLFFNAKRREWDERGEVYVRYGAPEKVTYNPVGEKLVYRFATGPDYPMNSLLWEYPELGMRVHMQDRLLSEYYLLPVTRDYDPDPQPHPDSLARMQGSLATRGGRGVFRILPPGVTPIPINGHVARFEGEDGPRLLAQVETPGGPADSVWAEWVVMDTARTVVARERRPLAGSACDVAEWRVGDFARSLAPGRYWVGLTVRNDSGGRGVFREEIDVPANATRLSMSDVVVSCGKPQIVPGAPTVRIEPNPKGQVVGNDPLTAYFEIYHLQLGGDGQARFEFVYTVKSDDKDPRIWIQRMLAPRSKIPEISASREGEHAGNLRRQFVTVPVHQLPAGKYRLEITVKDRVAGSETTRMAPFVKG